MKRGIIVILLYALAIFGWCRGLYQFCTSDFEASWKREIIYGIGIPTGLNCVIGFFNIHDTPRANAGKDMQDPVKWEDVPANDIK